MKRKYYNTNNKLFTPGAITTLAGKLDNGDKLKANDKLTDDELKQVPPLFAGLEPDFIPSEIEDRADIKGMAGRDFKALLYIMYMYPRSAYRTGPAQITASDYCSAVSLPLVGFKKYRNKNYNDWRISSSYFEIVDGHPVCSNVDKFIAVDMLLGYGLRSTEATNEGIMTTELWGLQTASAFLELSPDTSGLSPELVRIMRKLGFGNRKGNYATGYGSSTIAQHDVQLILKRELTPQERYWIRFHNNCNQVLRHLITQRWCYYRLQRSDNMIGSFSDWDTHITSIDTDANSMLGVRPKQQTILNDNKGLFGL